MLCVNACEFNIDFCLYTAYIYNPSFEHPIILADSPGCPSYWSGGYNVIVIKSQSDNYGGVVAADGNQLLVLSNGAYITQSVTFTPGLTYLLTFSAASSYFDDAASLAVDVGSATMVMDAPLRSYMMATYFMRFVPDSTSEAVTFSYACARFSCTKAFYIDSVFLQKGEPNLNMMRSILHGKLLSNILFALPFRIFLRI